MNPAQDAVAVIVTAHNYGRYLDRCLGSIASQTVRPREVLVVDDASDDETEAVVRRFPEVRYVRVAFRNGNRARNFGFERVSCERVVFFDADNWMAPRFLETLGEALDADPGAAFAYCDRINVGEGDVSWYPEPMGLWRSRPFDAGRLRRANYIDLASLMRARCFPGFDEELKRYQDWALWLQIALRQGGRGCYVPEALFFYRVHGRSLSRNVDRDEAVWRVRRTYRLGLFFSLPGVRDSFRLYRLLRRTKSLFRDVFKR